MKKLPTFFLLLVILSACAPATDAPVRTPLPSPSPVPSATPTSTPMPDALWVDPAAPAQLVDLSQTWGIPLTDDPSLATQKLTLSDALVLCGFMPSLRRFQQ